jgi:hypothetical protein
MSEVKPARRISASRLKAIDDCTYKFYASEYLKVPEKVWPRTKLGSIAHGILEVLYRDRHRHVYDTVKKAGTIYVYPPLGRLVRAWQYNTKVIDSLMADIDPMVMLVLNHTDFLDTGATRRFEPEYEFNMTLRNGGTVKGFIDRMAFYGDYAIVWDYKSQRDRFESEEVERSYQSLVYQWHIWKTYGIPAEIRYVMLRHPPTKKEPSKHIQITMPATPAQLEGFELYLEHMYERVVEFGLKDAYVNFKDDKRWCQNVCTYFRATSYTSIKKRDTNALVGNYMPGTEPALKEDEYAETLHHAGCPRYNRV